MTSKESWAVSGDDPRNLHVVQADAPGLRVCFMTSNGPTQERARLIAAAPDLLKALKAATATCQTFLNDCGDVRDFTTQADINDWEEIISKAEGQ